MLSAPVSTYVQYIYNFWSDDAIGASTTTSTENILVTLAYFLSVCCKGHLNKAFGYSYLDIYQAEFIVMVLTGILADLNVVGQWDIIWKSSFELVSSMLALRFKMESNLGKFLEVVCFLGIWKFYWKDINVLPPGLAKRLRFGSDHMV